MMYVLLVAFVSQQCNGPEMKAIAQKKWEKGSVQLEVETGATFTEITRIQKSFYTAKLWNYDTFPIDVRILKQHEEIESNNWRIKQLEHIKREMRKQAFWFFFSALWPSVSPLSSSFLPLIKDLPTDTYITA